jgi:hypothetical protein
MRAVVPQRRMRPQPDVYASYSRQEVTVNEAGPPPADVSGSTSADRTADLGRVR